MFTDKEKSLLLFNEKPQRWMRREEIAHAWDTGWFLNEGTSEGDSNVFLVGLSADGLIALNELNARAVPDQAAIPAVPAQTMLPPDFQSPEISQSPQFASSPVPAQEFAQTQPQTETENNFQIMETVLPVKAKQRKVGTSIYPFGSDDFAVGTEFHVHAKSNSEEDLKAIRKTLKSAANQANRKYRENIPGETKEVTKYKKVDGKRTKIKETVPETRQLRKFIVQDLAPEQSNHPQKLGGVRVLRVAVD